MHIWGPRAHVSSFYPIGQHLTSSSVKHSKIELDRQWQCYSTLYHEQVFADIRINSTIQSPCRLQPETCELELFRIDFNASSLEWALNY